MENKRFITFIINVGNWIVRLAYINILWFLYSIMGLIILGIFPATAGLFSVIRQWLKYENMSSVWKVYLNTFKKEFVRSNIIGYLYLLIGIITYVDFKFLQTEGNIVFMTLSYTVLVILLIYGMMGLFLFPVLVHYDLKTVSFIKYTFFITVSHPLSVLLTVLVLIVACLIMLFVPSLIVFYGLSIPAYIVMWSAYRVFTDVDFQSSGE